MIGVYIVLKLKELQDKSIFKEPLILKNIEIQDVSDNGFFGEYGGQFSAETLMPLIKKLETAWQEAKNDKDFWQQYMYYIENYTGRPSPLWHAQRLSEHLGGPQIWLKREDCNHTGSHKINNAIGQVLLAKRMNKNRIIAETGAGQHGVATATVCALFNIPCRIYMGSVDMQRQQPNVLRMQALGAEVVAAESGSKTLKDALNEAIKDWTANVDDTFYLIGTVAGPHPYPQMVRDFQKIIGIEVKKQFAQQQGGLPDALVACIGGGSNAIGLFYDFLADDNVEMIGVEAGGKGSKDGEHAASLTKGRPGILHGFKSYLLQDKLGNVIEPWSISAGLDYPSVGPEHAYLKDINRVSYETVSDNDAMRAFKLCMQCEGIIPAIESSHAIAWVMNNAKHYAKDKHIVINLSGRGDKDMETYEKYLESEI